MRQFWFWATLMACIWGIKNSLKKARQIAGEKGLKVALLTFPESPKLAFVRYQPELLLHLQSPEDRFQKIKRIRSG